MAESAHSFRRRLTSVAAVASTVVVLGACSAPASRYSSDGEAFLRSDEVFNTFNIDFTEPKCERPTSTSEGGEMLCQAVGAEDGHRYVFTFVVTGGNAIELQRIRVLYNDGSSGDIPVNEPVPGPDSAPPPTTNKPRPTTTAAGNDNGG